MSVVSSISSLPFPFPFFSFNFLIFFSFRVRRSCCCTCTLPLCSPNSFLLTFFISFSCRFLISFFLSSSDCSNSSFSPRKLLVNSKSNEKGSGLNSPRVNWKNLKQKALSPWEVRLTARFKF